MERVCAGQKLRIEHVKPDGRIIHLSEGKVMEADPKESRLVLKRTGYTGRGRYDGLETPKQSGDYALTTLMQGVWHYRHDYYRLSGELIGRYFNINTPVELYPDRMRYVDLEMDVAIWPDGSLQHLDEEELLSLHEAGMVTSRLVERTRAEAARAERIGLSDRE